MATIKSQGGEMKTILKCALMVLWLFFFSIAFLWIWTRTPALWFTNLPDETYASLMRAFDVRGAEDAADVQMLIVLGVGFVLASILLALFSYIRKRKSRMCHNQ